MRCTSEEKEAIRNFLIKADERRKNDPAIRTASFRQLFSSCSPNERTVLKKFLKLNPRAYGFKGPRYGMIAPPRGLVMIRREHVPGTVSYLSNGTHFLPRGAYHAYKKMNRAMEHDIGRRVFVLSGYRSPAYQLVVFLEALVRHRFDMKRTAKGVAIPGYSEHGFPGGQGIDFTTLTLAEKGVDDLSFERTREYRWLTKRGGEFGFHLSYPRGNKWGVMFEPWHWHFSGVIDRGKRVPKVF